MARFDAWNRHSLGRTILEEHEGRHSRDAISSSNFIDMVDVHLGKSKTAG